MLAPVNCPACGYYNPVAQERCFHCGLLLPLSAGDAKCARHPDVRASGACSRCGTFGCGTCLTQRGEAWLCPDCVGRSARLPWDEREQLGLWRAWWRTSVMMISSPVQTLQSAEPSAPVGSSMLYAGLSSLAGFVPTLLLYAVVLVPVMALSSAKADLGLPGAAVVGVGAVAYIGVLFGMQVVSVLFFAGLDHVALLMLGAQPKSYAVSLRASALAMGPYLLGLVPLCGLYVFPLWSLVLRIIGLVHLHRTTGGKAAAAVLLPGVLLCGGLVALYAAVFALAMSAGR